MINIARKYREQLIFVCIVLYTFLFVTWITYSENPFLQDDNGLQWNPVIEAAFRQFFSTGHIPQYNFYQLKGYDIFQAGYYGLYNPLMYLAYLCSLVCRTNPLSAYTYISFMIGNRVVYQLGRKSSCSETLSLMIMLLYSASGVFFYYSYWYYVMENYWMIPLMFLLFLGDDGGKRSWYQYGLWMAFSVYLGNIQFTMYHWMICGITMLVVWTSGKKGYWRKIGTNISIALLFSLFPLIGLWRASARSKVYGGRNADFMADPVKFLQYLDESIFGARGINLLLLCAFFIGAYYLVRQIRKNRKVSDQVSILLASMVVSVFFLLFMGGEEYLLAKVLYRIPGLSSCRYLMKILSVLPGCMLPLSVYAFLQIVQEGRQNKRLRIVTGYLLAMVCFFIGVNQSQDAYKQSFPGAFGGKTALDISEDIHRMYDITYLDFNNYRIVNLISGQSDYNNFDAYYTETHNVNSLLLGNLGTKLSVFSLGGYDNTFHSESLGSAVSIYREDPARWSSPVESEMFSVRNTVNIRTLMHNINQQENYEEEVINAVRKRYLGYDLLKTEYQYDAFDICRGVILSLQKDGAVQQVAVGLDELGVVHKSAEVFDTLAQNGVKYMLYDQSIWTEVEQFLRECEAMDIGYTFHSVSDSCKYIELDNGTVPIASNQDAQALPMIAGLDMLQISVAENDTQCNLSLTYDDKLKARYYADQNSKGVELETSSDRNHNIVMNLTDCKSGCIVITYENILNLFCLIQMVLLMAVIMILMTVYHKAVTVDGRIINICAGVLAAVYTIYILRVCLHTEALVPDERWFLNIINTVSVHSVKDYLTLPNYLCYGPLYWLVMSRMGSFVSTRILCGIMLLSVIPAIVISILSHNPNQKLCACFPAVILCLTAPLSWFTGKIIGPEIMGYSLGVWGCTIGVRSVSKDWKMKKAALLLSGILIGVSVGVKLNYCVFGAFLGLYMILSGRKDKFGEMIVDAFCLLVGGIAGFICSSPICIFDFEGYINNFEKFRYSLVYLKNVFFKDFVEWDFVNSGGLNHTIISFVAFVCFFLIGIRECFIKKEKKPALFIASYISIFALFLLCSKEQFLGWYLLPAIYFISINLSNRKLTYMVLMINMVLAAPDIRFQLFAKEAQIRYVSQEEAIANMVNHYTQQWNDYVRYVFVDNEIDGLPLDVIYYYSNAKDEKEILFLSDKALYNNQLNEIYQNALYRKNGYRFLAHKNSIYVILYERGTASS